MEQKVNQNTKEMVVHTSKQVMESHSFFADHLNKKSGKGSIKGNKSFIPWLVNRSGGHWNNPHLVVNFDKIHISPEILEVWKEEAKKDPSLPDLDNIPGIAAMKKDMTGFEIKVEPEMWKLVRSITRYYS